MADFYKAFEKMMNNEGGYVLHEVTGDRGGQTYAGIARKFHPEWEGWKLIDQNHVSQSILESSVKSFYKRNFWDKIKGRDISNQFIANSIFDFAVNAGVSTAVKLVQILCNTKEDGIMGSVTLNELNQFNCRYFQHLYAATRNELNQIDGGYFENLYALAKIARYTKIVNSDRSQNKFLLGWINRTLKGVA